MSLAESLPGRMSMSAVAGMGAACFCHPFDVLRVQMQVGANASLGFGGTVNAIVARDGVIGLYNGLSAAFLRQWMYGSGRMGIYSFLLNDHKAKNNNSAPNSVKKVQFGLIAGGVGSFIGTPSEVAIVRMAADSQLPVEQRRNYKHIFDCLSQIWKNEGFANGLYKGASVTVIRAMALAGSQMPVFSETKDYLVKHRAYRPEGLDTTFIAALAGSFVCNCCSLPFDVVKSRIQNMPAPAAGSAPIYTGMVDCAKKSIAAEGPTVLWKGFMPAFVKLAPYTVISLTLLENITRLVTGKGAM